MTSLKSIITEKRATIPDSEIKERSWVLLFRHNPKLEILLARDEEGDWSFPGGQLDKGETAEEAAWRELKEETDVNPKDLHFHKTIYHDKEHKLKVSHIFYTLVPKITKIKSEDDVDKTKWFPAHKEFHLDGLSKPKLEAIRACTSKVEKTDLKEALELAKQLNLPVQLLTEGAKRTNSGFLIVMEGIDGSGKSTQCKALRKLLEKKKWKVTETAWNTSPAISKAIKKGKKEKWLSPLLYSLLHASDMVWRYENVIKPALEEGHVVLCDRYHYSSYIRDQLRGVRKEVLDEIYKGMPEPDMVLHFEVHPRMAVERLLKGKGFKHYSSGMDIGYSKDLEECAMIYEGNMDKAYHDLLPKAKNYHKINTARSISETFHEIAEIVKEKVNAQRRQVMQEHPMTYKDLMSEMYVHGFTMDEETKPFRVPENFDRYHEGSGWQAYRGGNDWENGTTGVAVYLNPNGYNKEMARIWFEIKFPPEIAEAKDSSKGYGTPAAKAVEKWGQKAAVRWLTTADRIRKETRQFHGEHDGYQREWVQRKPWMECFIEALKHQRMQPFVGKWGVDHTKWVGMKQENMDAHQLCEAGEPSKFWWMDPKGELIPVGYEQHSPEGRKILKTKFNIDLGWPGSVYTTMYENGYVRVGFAGLWGQYIIEINHAPGKTPNSRQWQALKDLAIEMGASEISDNTDSKTVRVDESQLIFENFHENKEWFLYEGENTITAVFEDNSRQTFKLHYHANRLGEDRAKHKKKAANTWKRLARDIRNSAGLTEVGNPVVIPWQECFQKALQDPMMKEFIDDLRATPIFESFGLSLEYYWLAPNGKADKVESHESGGMDILQHIGAIIPGIKGTRSVYDSMYRLGYARVVIGDHMFPLIVDTGNYDMPKLSREQRNWLEDKSFELGLKGMISTSRGDEIEIQNLLREMTYDELRNSMKKFTTINKNGEKVAVGDKGREERSKHVNVRPLRVISTVGKDKKDRDTSLFSYKSDAAWGDPGDRYQGFIRFLNSENSSDPDVEPVAPSFEQQAGGDVEVNCSCPDYRYVWAEPNAKADAGVTSHVQPINVQEAPVFPQSGPVGRAAPEGKPKPAGMSGYHQFKAGGNDNQPELNKGIRNPDGVPGLCKHLMAVAKYLEVKTSASSAVAPDTGKKSPSPVTQGKPAKPVNIFETMKQFAMSNPTFTVNYED